MGAETIFDPVPLTRSWGKAASTHYVVLEGRNVDYGLPPIIWCHSQPGSDSWSTVLASEAGGLAHSTFRAGYRQAHPFTGRNWGHQSNMSPSGTGGTGLQAIDDIVSALGNPPTVVLAGVSMGGLNALRWAWLHPTRVEAVRVFAPAWDLLWLYDTNGDFKASLDATYGTSDRLEFEAATATYDPRRNASAIAAIPAPVTAFVAMDDTVVGTSGIEAWAINAGIDLTTTPTGGHIAWALGPSYDELDLLRAVALAG